MGVAGAAWSTVIARGLFALFGLYLITRRSSPVQLILRRPKLRPRMIWNLTRIGIPSSMQYVVRVIAYGALLRYVTSFPDGAAAHNALAVGFRLDMLATFTGAGWGAASAAIVGQALGRGNYARARAAGWMAAAIDGVMMAAIGVFYYLCAPWLMTVFGADPDVQPEFRRTWELGIEYLQISVFGYLFAGIGITLAQALNGAGSTKTPLALDTVVFLGMLIPISAYIAHNSDGFGRNHLWVAFVGVMALAAALYAFVWYRGHWRHKRIQ